MTNCVIFFFKSGYKRIFSHGSMSREDINISFLILKSCFYNSSLISLVLHRDLPGFFFFFLYVFVPASHAKPLKFFSLLITRQSFLEFQIPPNWKTMHFWFYMENGQVASLLSRSRPDLPILAFTSSFSVHRRFNLQGGLIPFYLLSFFPCDVKASNLKGTFLAS